MDIIDISHHQPSDQINWEQAAKEVKLVIIRVQYGSRTVDREYKKHVANCKKIVFLLLIMLMECLLMLKMQKLKLKTF